MSNARHPISFLRPAMMSLVVAWASLAGCGGGEPVTPEALAAARKLWAGAAINDYELEWTASGSTSAHYVVTVRSGDVRRIESVLPDGRRVELHPGLPRYYSVDGLFTTIADELAQLRTDRPFGQPKGTKVVMKFRPEPRLGYPLSYRRNILGTSQALSLEVVKLIPAGSS